MRDVPAKRSERLALMKEAIDHYVCDPLAKLDMRVAWRVEDGLIHFSPVGAFTARLMDIEPASFMDGDNPNTPAAVVKASIQLLYATERHFGDIPRFPTLDNGGLPRLRGRIDALIAISQAGG